MDKELTNKAEARYQIIHVIERDPTLSQRDLAREICVSIGSVNSCFMALIDKGAVTVENFRASGDNMRYAYVMTPESIREKARMSGRFLQRKIIDYAPLKNGNDGLQHDQVTESKNE